MAGKLYLMNSAMMPQEGFYTRKDITPLEWKKLFLEADEIVSSIAYTAIQEEVGSILGIDIPLDLFKRNTVFIEDCATILVVKLSYRVCASMKGHLKGTDISHYEFILMRYFRNQEVFLKTALK